MNVSDSRNAGDAGGSPAPHEGSAPRPWWREWGLLLVVALPLAVVVACVVTFVIAVKQPDGVVADDYYKRGLAINKSIERDRRAAEIGVTASVRFDPASGELSVRLQPADAAPDTLQVQLANAVTVDRDLAFPVRRGADGVWRAQAAGVAGQRWDVVVEAAGWRLAGRLARLEGEGVTLRPAQPAD